MPEKFKAETAERKETQGEGVERLKHSLGEMSLALQKEGVPVGLDGRINPNQFRDTYSKQEIKADRDWVEQLGRVWERAAVSGHQMSWLLSREQIEKQLRQQNTMGEILEMLATLILHKHLGKDFIVVRTAKYDDARFKADNIILDRKTGNVLCAFDEVGDGPGGPRFEEKRRAVLDRNRQGGADLKYGIAFKKRGKAMKLVKDRVSYIPIFYLALPVKEIQEVLHNPKRETEVFRKFLNSIGEQIEETRKGPVKAQTKSRLDFFMSVLEKL